MAIEDVPSGTNCGRKTTKKTPSFGFITAVSSAWRNPHGIRKRRSCDSAAARPACRRNADRTAPIASQNRYATQTMRKTV